MRDAEVDQRDGAVVAQHDVAGLQVAVHDACGVDDRQRVADLGGIAQRDGRAQRLRELRPEMPEREVLHRDVAVLARHAEVVDPGHGRIVDVVEQLELVDEALEVTIAGQRARGRGAAP